MAKTKVYFHEIGSLIENAVDERGEPNYDYAKRRIDVRGIEVDLVNKVLIVDIAGEGVPDVDKVLRLMSVRTFIIPNGVTFHEDND